MTTQNTTKNNAETKHTDISYHTGSCMAHLNCLPPRAAVVNYWCFLLAYLMVDVGIKQNAKCKILLCKIDGEMNVQNCGFPRNYEMETVATCSMTDGNGSYHGLAPSFFKEMTHSRRQKHCRPQPDNPNGPSKFRKYRVYLQLLHLFTSARSRLLYRG